jgi:hypothetical protein
MISLAQPQNSAVPDTLEDVPGCPSGLCQSCQVRVKFGAAE